MKITKPVFVSITFLVSMIVLSVTLVPATLETRYYWPCMDPGSLKDLVPISCGRETKVVFKLEEERIVAEIEDLVFEVAIISNNTITPVNKELWGMFQACCIERSPPRKEVVVESIVKGLLIATILSAIFSLVSSYVFSKISRITSRKTIH